MPADDKRAAPRSRLLPPENRSPEGVAVMKTLRRVFSEETIDEVRRETGYNPRNPELLVYSEP